MNPQHFYKAILTISQDFTNYNVKVYDKKRTCTKPQFQIITNGLQVCNALLSPDISQERRIMELQHYLILGLCLFTFLAIMLDAISDFLNRH